MLVLESPPSTSKILVISLYYKSTRVAWFWLVDDWTGEKTGARNAEKIGFFAADDDRELQR